jgi:CHAT domain-containing protein
VRWLYEANLFPPEILTVRPGMTRYLIPTYPAIPEIQLLPLPEAEKEAAFLRAEFMAVAVPPLLPDVRRLLEGPAGFDLLHFAGHGFAASATINEPQLVLEGEVSGQDYIPVYLRADAVEARANFGALRPMVVLNACQAGRQNWKLTGIGGFAQAFLRRGAGAFVGTLWSVGDAPARNFTEAMYRALKAGDPMAAAVRAGRAAARAAGDATWLAYAVYGHPAARLQ